MEKQYQTRVASRNMGTKYRDRGTIHTREISRLRRPLESDPRGDETPHEAIARNTSPEMRNMHAAHDELVCGARDRRIPTEPPGCKAIITVTHAPHAAIMGDGTIDGRGGEKLLHRDASWWDLAERARTGDRKQVPRLIEADLAAEQTFPSQIPQRLIG